MLKWTPARPVRWALLVLCLSGACGVSPGNYETPVSAPAAFSEPGQVPLPDRWWLSFKDPELNRLIDIALQDNFDLRTAFARLEQAQANASKAGAELVPAVDGATGIARIIDDPPVGGRITTDFFSLGLAAGYELDLWGRIRAGALASELDAVASALDVQTAAITLTSTIASTWYRLIEQRKQLDLLNRQIATNSQNVDIVAARFAGGQATVADLFQQSQVLEAARGDQTSVVANIAVLENRLAILTGRAPGNLALDGAADFPELPAPPATGFTADLIQRRPDIRSAYDRLQAADLRITAAIADRFPRISLSTSIDTAAPDLQDFFNNWLATLAGNLVVPLIDGGRRAAEVERTRAATEEAMTAYGRQILDSLEEVENALNLERQQHQRLASLETQLRLLSDANDQIRLRYIYGAIDFLRVLTSQISLQSKQREVIQAERELIDFRIDVYRSLAGGWPLARPARPKDRNDG